MRVVSIVVIGGILEDPLRPLNTGRNFLILLPRFHFEFRCRRAMLRYNKLVLSTPPTCLMPCFLYIGIYVEDETINCNELLELWIAEGFLKAKHGFCLEELAEEYLEDLIHRNLMIVRDRRWDGKILYCFIHDIVREFCLKVVEKEKFLCVLHTTQGVGCKEHRVVVSDELLSKVKQRCHGGLELHSCCSVLLSTNLRTLFGVVDLPDNGNGSRVIVTTRLSNLATAHLSSSSPFEMKFLDEGNSWELFCEKAFGGGKEDCPVELEEIGKKIVRRCRGLPLSIIVVGGHLRKSPRAIEYWEKLSDSINPISSLGRDDQCLEILRSSYQHLPACLKPCFLYLAVYREDHWINVSELVNYWVGEGFIKPKRGLILEEVAEYYLEDLIDRNLVLVRERRWNGKAEHCAIHDVVRELCVKVATKEKFIGVVEDTTRAIGCEERRIVVQLPAELSSVSLKSHLLLRSIACQRGRLLNESPVDFRLLRVSANIDMDTLKLLENDMNCPTPSFQQVNLRYLKFCVPFAKLSYCIHSSISLLWNLQTLNVSSVFGGGISVPYEIWEVPQLRHLQFNRLCLPYPLPSEGSDQEEEVVILKNIHTLIGVEDLKLTEEVCKRIPNIKRLGLSYRTLPEGDGEEEASSSYYCLHNLGRLSKLESLECRFGGDSKWRYVIQSLTLPSSLVELTIKNCHWEDLTKTIKSIPQLRYLELWFVRGSEWDLAEEEEFPHLRILKIISPHGLINWNASSYNFPVLEELRFYFVGESGELREIPFDLGEIPTLRLIYLLHCSASCALSAMRTVAEQENLGNENLQLSVRFSKMEELERFQKMVGEEGLSTNSLNNLTTLTLYNAIKLV